MPTRTDSEVFEHLDLALLCRVFSECSQTALASPSITAPEREALRLSIARSLTRSLVRGERNSERMKQTALEEAVLPLLVAKAGY